MRLQLRYWGILFGVGLCGCSSRGDARAAHDTTPKPAPAKAQERGPASPQAEKPPADARRAERRETTPTAGVRRPEDPPRAAAATPSPRLVKDGRASATRPSPTAPEAADAEISKDEAIRALIPVARENLPSTVPDLKRGKVHLKRTPTEEAPDNIWSIDLKLKQFGIKTKSEAGAGRRIVLTILRGRFVRKDGRWVAMLRPRIMS